MRRKFLVLFLIAIFFTFFGAVSYGKSVINIIKYNSLIKIEPVEYGELYWSYNANGDFFANTGIKDVYNSKCKIKSNSSYSFIRGTTRGIIAAPKIGYYFNGFYNLDGSKCSLKTLNVDIIRITSKGYYYYDYIASMNNAQFKNYSKTKFDELIKTKLKFLYGTSRYKTIGNALLYFVPQNNSNYIAQFSKQKTQILTGTKIYTKSYGENDFFIAAQGNGDCNLTFTSKNPKTVSVGSNTGIATIKGEGKALININAAMTTIYKASTLEVWIKVFPIKIDLTKAFSPCSKELFFSWTKDSKCSGYVITIATDNKFSKNVISKTINSSKTITKLIKQLKSKTKYYAKVKAYKISCNEKMSGPWSNITCVKTK